jgi:hypothetical protein
VEPKAEPELLPVAPEPEVKAKRARAPKKTAEPAVEPEIVSSMADATIESTATAAPPTQVAPANDGQPPRKGWWNRFI